MLVLTRQRADATPTFLTAGLRLNSRRTPLPPPGRTAKNVFLAAITSNLRCWSRSKDGTGASKPCWQQRDIEISRYRNELATRHPSTNAVLVTMEYHAIYPIPQLSRRIGIPNSSRRRHGGVKTAKAANDNNLQNHTTLPTSVADSD